MAERETKASSEGGKLKEPHLLDVSNTLEIAQWIIQWALVAAAGGIIENAAWELLTGLKRRFGKSKIDELKTECRRLLNEVKNRPEVSEAEVKARVDTLFRDF